LIEEKEYEGHCKCMKNLIGLIPRQAISNGRWNAMWFLTVEKLFPLKDEAKKQVKKPQI
jgi:hypothetical protein